jgi:hypothetical protein
MGKIFKTPKDDSVEETLRAMHLANTFDNTYEWTVGWVRTIIVALLTALAVSGVEHNTDFALWESTVEWFFGKVGDFGSWLTNLVS